MLSIILKCSYKVIGISIICLLQILPIPQCLGQNEIANSLDSLEIFGDKKDLSSYLRKLISVHFEIKDSGDYKLFYDLDSYYDFFREPNDSIEFFDAREANMCHAFHIKKYLGDHTKALPYYLKAHEYLIDKDCGDKFSWFIENNIGNIYTRLGDYKRAEYFYRILEGQLICSNSTKLARYYTNLGRFYKSINKEIEAIDAFKKGIIRSAGNDNALAANYLNLSDLYISIREYDSGIHHLKKFKSLNPDIINDRLYYYYELQGDACRLVNKYATADSFYVLSRESISELNNTGNKREVAKLYVKRAQNLLENSSFDLSDSIVNEGFRLLNFSISSNNIPSVKNLYAENTFIDLLKLKSKRYEISFRQTKDPKFLNLALLAIERAILVNDKLRLLFAHDESKLDNIVTNKTLANRALDLAYEIYIIDNKKIPIDKLEELFLKSKNLLYVEKYFHKEVLEQLNESDNLKYKSIRNDLVDLYDEQTAVNNKSQKVLDLIFLKEDTLNSIIKTKSLLAGKKKGKYIDYILTNQNLYSLNNFNDNVVFNRHCDTEQIVQNVSSYRKYILIKDSIKILREYSHQLYNCLIEPIQDLPNEFVIYPDDILSYVNFDLLCKDVKGDDWLIDNCLLSYSYGESTLGIAEKRLNENLRILCLSPSYEETKVSIEQQHSITRGEIYPLKFAEKETSEIKGLFKVSDGYDHIEGMQFNNLCDIDIIHFAGHAISNKNQSYLAINSEDQKQNLYSQEIEKMNLDVELVTLSACETGTGDMAYGEGVNSLAKSFAVAGAKTTLSSLWTVNDNSTYKIMELFYANLIEGVPLNVALRNAKLDFKNNVSKELSHPYYWAGFVISGQVDAFENNESIFFQLFIILLLLVSGFYLLIVKNKS